MRKANLISIDTPLPKCLIRLSQEYYVQVESYTTRQYIKNGDAVRSNDLRQDHNLSAHDIGSTMPISFMRSTGQANKSCSGSTRQLTVTGPSVPNSKTWYPKLVKRLSVSARFVLSRYSNITTHRL